MYRPARMVPVVVAVVCWLGCEDSTEKPVVSQKFEGILRTDPDCNIVGGDTTDFLPRPQVSVDTTLVPPVAGPPLNNSLDRACPNPAEFSTQIYFEVSEPDSVWLLAYDEPNTPPVDTLFNRSAQAGVYMVTWSAPRGPGIYRVRMFTAGGFRSYGDVQFTGPPVSR